MTRPALKWAVATFVMVVSCSAQNAAIVVKQGEAVFSKTCATGYCHGIRGGPSGAPRLAGRGFSLGEIVFRLGELTLEEEAALRSFGNRKTLGDFE